MVTWKRRWAMDEQEERLTRLGLNCRYQSAFCARRGRFYEAEVLNHRAAGYFTRLMRLQERLRRPEIEDAGSRPTFV